jgi:hypothetical protein
MYSDICNNVDRPIKPAPDPRYLLNKYYGNLTIDEYRKLLKSDHLLYVVNKPLTHSLPELYEDNNEYLVTGKPQSMLTTSGNIPSVPSSLQPTTSTLITKNKYGAFSKSIASSLIVK